MTDIKVTPFELKVLRFMATNHRIPTGNKLVAIVAAARRLEKKGLAGKGTNWYTTKDGDKYLEEHPET